MTEKEKALSRFEFKPEAVEVELRPQCLDCIKNVSRLSCKQFPTGTKPPKYLRNLSDCPYKTSI